MRTLMGIALCFVVCCSGCGSSGPAKATLYPVSGKITVAGKPLGNCSITFSAVTPIKDGEPGYSGTVKNGEYTLGDGKSGAAAGKYKVVLSLGADAAKEAMMKGAGAAGQGYTAASELFPKEFGDAATSTKEVEVKTGSNTINIEL